MKPIQRSSPRLKCGKAYYTLKRYMEWLLGKSEYWGGYTSHNLIYRRIWNDAGTCKADEEIAENHAVMMYEPLLQ
jgi:hypothetical protein